MVNVTALGLAAVLVAGLAAPAHAQFGGAGLTESAGAQVTGAGSTFAQIALRAWSAAFQAGQYDEEYQPIGDTLDYEPVGSQAGMMRVQAGAVDFGASDVPLPSAELAKLGLAQFPFVMGGIVPVVSLRGVPAGAMRLSGEVLADIYLAQITSWDDPAIKALNPDLTLPATPIDVVHRADGSGTTFHFTSFLAASSPRWKAEVGSDLVVRWPAGIGVEGNDGVAAAVGRRANSIGYVDFAQARRSGLSYALVRNGAGAFVRPSIESFQAGAASARWRAEEDFASALGDPTAPDAYPIVASTFALMPLDRAGSRRSRAALSFFAWSFDNGAAAATELGYVALPPPLIAQVKEYWATRLSGPQ